MIKPSESCQTDEDAGPSDTAADRAVSSAVDFLESLDIDGDDLTAALVTQGHARLMIGQGRKRAALIIAGLAQRISVGTAHG
jgi:hypothetical protein